MRKFIIVLSILLISASALAIAPTVCRKELDETYNSPDEDSLNIALQNLGLCLEIELYPNDVKEFLNRESVCIHIAGEEPYAGARALELERLNNVNKCGDIQGEKQVLLKRYEKDPMIERALKDYGNKIYPGNNAPATVAPDNSGGGVI